MRRSGVLLALWLELAGGGAAADPTPKSLLAVAPRGPWMLRDLERERVDLVSYDPDTGIAYLTATPAEERRLVSHGFALATVEPDLQAGLRRLQAIPDLGLYHTYAETVALLDSLHVLHPGITHLEIIGRSLEGRDIPALEISADPQFADPAKPEVLVVGCHHAREIMTVEVPLHLARTLVEGYGRDPYLTRLVDTRRLWIVPMLNPDGHVYQERMQRRPGWRKNRRVVLGDTLGVDLNRNYSYQWGLDEIGSSPSPADETYRGQAPFSEPETEALRHLVEHHRFVVALSYHSYGGLLLYPWGYTRDELTEDQPLFAALADSMVRGNGYRPGNAFLGTIYLTNGGFDDYMYGELGPRKPRRTLSFTPELNTGSQGFWPPEALIAPTCAAMLPMNLFVLRVADNVRAPMAPPAPLLTAVQDAGDARRIHLSWTQPEDPGNPVEHYEVFELEVVGDSLPGARPAFLAAPGRSLLARGLVRPRGGELWLRLEAGLEPLWDYAYCEVRPSRGGAWRALAAKGERDLDPTGRNAGHGLTGSMVGRVLGLPLAPDMEAPFDLAVRLDPYPDSPRHAWLRAQFLPAATYGERRRVIAPEVRERRYDVLAERSGLFAYGVTAVDVHGQRAESDLSWFVIPMVEVQVSDVELRVRGLEMELRWRTRSPGQARFEAWARPAAARDPLLDAPAEWARGSYALAAVAAAAEPRVSWNARPGTYAVLLRGLDADGPRLWGPWLARLGARTVLHAPSPNPCNPSTRLVFEVAADGAVRLDICRADGRRVRRLVDGPLDAGMHSALWDGKDDVGRALASGVYLVRLRAGTEVPSRRVVLLR